MFVLNFIKPLLDPNIMSRVKLSKTSTKSYILQISAGIMSIITIVLLGLNFFGMFRLNYGFIESLPTLLNVFVLFAIGFAINLYTYIATQNTAIVEIVASGLSTILMMFSIIDYKYLPEFIQKILKFSPTYYYTELLNNFNPIYMLIQFGFLTFFVTLIIITLKYKKVK
jgi:hypothetical protein